MIVIYYVLYNYQKIFFQTTALILAVQNEFIEIVKILLSNKNLDINFLNILK